MRAVAFDFGSNTVGYLVGEQDPDGPPRVLARDSRFVRLAEGMGAGRHLGSAALDRAEAWAREMGRLLGAWAPERRRAVATEAVRRADNAEALRRRVEPHLGCPLETIPGEEEGRLTFHGVRLAMPDGPLAVLDIGGGSTELARGTGEDGEPQQVVSLPLGAVVLTEQHGEDWPRLVAAVAEVLDPYVARDRDARLVVLGGTAVNVALLDQQRRAWQDEDVEGHTVTGSRLVELRDRTRSVPAARRVAELGIPAGRADVMVGAMAILEGVRAALGVDHVTCSRHSLRHGVLRGLLEDGP